MSAKKCEECDRLREYLLAADDNNRRARDVIQSQKEAIEKLTDERDAWKKKAEKAESEIRFRHRRLR